LQGEPEKIESTGKSKKQPRRWQAGSAEPADAPDSRLDPDAIAASYWHVLRQPRNAWTWEVELRPWVETF
jgi:hypothetical protein